MKIKRQHKADNAVLDYQGFNTYVYMDISVEAV